MEINICEDKKIVEVWLTNGEESDVGLAGLYERYGSRGYLVAVFKSGCEDLTGLTAGLLIHNQKMITG